MDIKIIDVNRSLSKLNQQQVVIVDRKYSVLGNPYTHLPIARTNAKYKVNTVEEAVEEYDSWLLRTIKEEFKEHYRPVGNALTDLYNKALTLHINGRLLYLACHCKDELDPLPKDHVCHCDVLKRQILLRYKRDCESYNGLAYLTKEVEKDANKFNIYYRQNKDTTILISVSDDYSDILLPLSGSFYESVEAMVTDVTSHI